MPRAPSYLHSILLSTARDPPLPLSKPPLDAPSTRSTADHESTPHATTTASQETEDPSDRTTHPRDESEGGARAAAIASAEDESPGARPPATSKTGEPGRRKQNTFDSYAILRFPPVPPALRRAAAGGGERPFSPGGRNVSPGGGMQKKPGAQEWQAQVAFVPLKMLERASLEAEVEEEEGEEEGPRKESNQ